MTNPTTPRERAEAAFAEAVRTARGGLGAVDFAIAFAREEIRAEREAVEEELSDRIGEAQALVDALFRLRDNIKNDRLRNPDPLEEP